MDTGIGNRQSELDTNNRLGLPENKWALAQHLLNWNRESLARYLEILEEETLELIVKKNTEIYHLRAFAREMIDLADWPDGGDIDGFEFQDAAVKHGVLIPERRTEPCGEGCSCDAFYSNEEWKEGITCCRIADALKKAGEPKSP